MAQIDLKNATLYLRDGYTGGGGNGAINLLAGYIAGASVLAVDTFVGAVETGDYVTIAGSVSQGALIHHKITAHSETGSDTTSITVTPALGAAVLDGAVITALPHEVEIKIGEGNFTYSEKSPREYVKDRGRLDNVKDADEEPVDVSFDFVYEFIKASTGETPTIPDVLYNRGEAAGWISSDPDQCQPFCVDIQLYHNTPCGTDDDEEITIKKFRFEELQYDLRGASIACSGKANVKEAEVVRL